MAFFSRTFLAAGLGCTEDTFKLKADAARKLCLGGVMVWAVSQDYTEQGGAAAVAAAAGTGTGGSSKKRADTVIHETRYSKQLQRVTYYESPKAVEVVAGLRRKFAICPKGR